MKTVLLSDLTNAAKNSTFHLSDQKTQHVRKVLRMEWGESLNITDGAGKLYRGSLEKSGDRASVKIDEVVKSHDKPLDSELVIGLSKNNTMDWLVEKAVECGVTRILPIVMSRSVVKTNAKDASKYSERWQSIMDGAVEQSERLWRPIVEHPQGWSDWLKSSDQQVNVAKQYKRIGFFSELRSNPSFSEHESLASTWKALQNYKTAPIQVFIGPEGGFADTEREQLIKLGFEAHSLGETVLRVETAVIAALTLIKFSRLL